MCYLPNVLFFITFATGGLEKDTLKFQTFAGKSRRRAYKDGFTARLEF